MCSVQCTGIFWEVSAVRYARLIFLLCFLTHLLLSSALLLITVQCIVVHSAVLYSAMHCCSALHCKER